MNWRRVLLAVPLRFEIVRSPYASLSRGCAHSSIHFFQIQVKVHE